MPVIWMKRKMWNQLVLTLFFWLFHQGYAQLSVVSSQTCGQDMKLRYQVSSFNSLSTRTWLKDGVSIVDGGISLSSKYSEDLSNTGSGYFELTIASFTKDDEGVYGCTYVFSTSSKTVTCEPTPPECEGKCCLILLIICGICAGITVVMWVICCWLQYKKEGRCQIWCCIWLIVHGCFAVIAWILWGISYWQRKEDCCHCCQKAEFIVPIVLDFCAAVAGIIWGIFCCLQYKGIIPCIPPCCGFCVCIDCEEKKEEPAFIKYAKQELQWMDQKIAKIKQNVNGGTDAAARLNKAEQERLDTCEKRCKEEEEKLSKDATNSYGERILDYINKLRVKMSELKKIQKEGNTLVKKETKKVEIEMKEKFSELPPSKPLETEGKWRPLPPIAPSK